MDSGVVDSPVTLVIRAPNQKYGDQTINCLQNWTVKKLKSHLSDVYPSKPSCKDQRLVYSGKLLLDHFTLKDVLRKQDEYHMLHLVCASRTPPASPKASTNKSLKSPAGPTVGHISLFRQHWLSLHQPLFSVCEIPVNIRVGPHLPFYQTHPYYHPMSLMWWQQLYVQQYFMHYHLMAASHHMRPDLLSSQSGHSGSQNHRAPADRHGNAEVQMNAQGGEVLNEDELNRDWLDWVYTFSRAAILLSIVYFYSSFSRFVMVLIAMVVLYLHQAGWFPFNLENDLPDDRPNQDEAEGEPQYQDLPEMDRAAEESSDDDGDSGTEGGEDPDSGPQNGFLSSTWSFIITFFMSLIPEGPANAAN
uniref:Homocysteine-responsive endoplasmic reticulum-resident ubiquitin-like domain member 2 protein n=1 Tax=Neogobius melanostomus TaxID=47308 RepID=A0A8C6WID5_9GOBI